MPGLGSAVKGLATLPRKELPILAVQSPGGAFEFPVQLENELARGLDRSPLRRGPRRRIVDEDDDATLGYSTTAAEMIVWLRTRSSSL